MMVIRCAGVALCTVALLCGCSQADYRKYVAYDAGPPPCTTDPTFSCAGAPPAPGLCVGDPGARNNTRRLPTNVGFAVGCQAYFTLTDCSTQDACFCVAADGGPAHWVCSN